MKVSNRVASVVAYFPPVDLRPLARGVNPQPTGGALDRFHRNLSCLCRCGCFDRRRAIHECHGQTVKGKDIQFSFKVDAQGQELQVEYSGTVDGDTMKGKVKLGDFGEGTFTGKKE